MADHQKILILDFAGQYTQLIARRVRENHVYSEVVPWSISASEIAARQPVGIILSGGQLPSVTWTRPIATRPLMIWACRCWVSATACS